MNSVILTLFRNALVLSISVFFVSGLSSSNDSNSGELQAAADVSDANAVGVVPNGGASGNSTQMEAVTAGDNTSGDELVSDLELPDSRNPVVEDPLIQNWTLVSFDISVPVYQSNELSLEVVWGDLNLTAGWVGDELWTVSSEFPTDTEELLTVTFYDKNGAIELASFSQQFRTDSNANKAFQISADQFDDDQFDDDGDGNSNIDEMIAGTDPLVDEDLILDYYALSTNVTIRLSVSKDFESRLS